MVAIRRDGADDAGETGSLRRAVWPLDGRLAVDVGVTPLAVDHTNALTEWGTRGEKEKQRSIN